MTLQRITNEPTPWPNPLVVVPKGENNVRLCLDIHNANTAIECICFPLPFSKLDLNEAFHQPKLHSESCYVMVFQTEDHIKQYKQLLLGINSAPEELQHVLQILADIENAVNIVDNIVFRKSDDEHDNGLNKVLKCLAENNITLNIKKCEFDKESIEYYGYVFSKDGMKPALNKIDALKNAVYSIDIMSL